ncbi:MAG: hypothetical protein LBH40_01325 [Alphaproteobacteria bacterium]|jgi:hypothetical protein|nr:hypothetical protein [Alphaproteobacteria bacterium]
MENENNNQKGKKVLWLSMFLIIVVIIALLVVYVLNGREFFHQNAKDIFNQYKTVVDESFKSITEDTHPVSIDSQTNRNIIELQDTIKKLQHKIDTTSSISNNYTQNIQFAVFSNFLLYQIIRGESFAMELESLLKVTSNPLLTNKLEKLKSSSTVGIKSKEEILNAYRAVYKDTYLAYLRTQDTLFSKIKYYFLYLVFIKKSNNNILEDNSITSILSNVEVYLKDSDYKKAYAEFMKIDVVPSNNTQLWLSNILEKIDAQEVILELKTELTKYITESK